MKLQSEAISYAPTDVDSAIKTVVLYLTTWGFWQFFSEIEIISAVVAVSQSTTSE